VLQQLEIIEVHLHEDPHLNLVVLKKMGSAKTFPVFTTPEIAQTLENLLLSPTNPPGMYALCLQLADYCNLELQHIFWKKPGDSLSQATVHFNVPGTENKDIQLSLPLHDALILSVISEAPLYRKGAD